MTRLAIPGPAGSLEALIVEPPACAPERYAVICHPHPLYGGTMDNKVVFTVARALEELNIATLRFNFRGVGASEGGYDEGIGETDDAAAVAAFGAARWPGSGLVLAGFSFGAYVAYKLASRHAPRHLITVAPPVGRFDFGGLPRPDAPWLLVQGGADELVDPARVVDWAKGFSPEPTLVLLPEVGHFFHGALNLLRSAVGEALRSG